MDEPDRRPQRVAVERLKLADFRNYPRLDVKFGPGPVVLTGDNGAGKTNLLEALSLLAPGRGLRRAEFRQMTLSGADRGFGLTASLTGPSGPAEIAIRAGASGEEPGEAARRVRIDGEPARSVDALMDHVRVVWITPAMDGLFSGPAGDRRRFLDRMVLTVDPAHGRRALDYERAMRGRNRLLAEDRADPAWFDAIERELAESGVAIAAARTETVALLSAMTARQPAHSPFPRAQLALAGWPEEEVAGRASADLEDEFRRRLAAGRGRDRAAGRTLDGPHRTDLSVRHGPKDMPAELCSTGEQKALLIGLVLAHARLAGDIAGFAPILLLDEIAAHLDPDRRAALFGLLDDLNAQAFMTGTDRSQFSALDERAGFFRVAGGVVTRETP